MKKFAIPAISLAALMASGIAFAQTTPGQQPAQQKQEPATQAPSNSGMNVTVDAKKAVLATSYIGSSVFTAANENVGDVNDLIFDDKGMIQAVVIGVGGFLGMGEKDVAMPLNKITVTRDETNTIKLTIQASRDDLDKAPAFDKTLFRVKTPAPESTSPGGGGSTTPGGGGSTTTP